MKKLDFGKIARWILVAIILGSIIAILIWSAAPHAKDSDNAPAVAWNPNMTIGNPEAENHYIVYADSMCPYCANFSLALSEGMDEFKKNYADTNKVYLEIRLADIIADHNVNSHRANLATYCAAEQGKFWNFYPALQKYLYENFYKKGTSATEKIEDKFYINLAEKNNIDKKKFASCLDSKKVEQELERASTKTMHIITGAPYFVFGKYRSSGFPSGGDFSTIEQMFRAGGVK